MERQSVDLSGHPDLVMIMLGFRLTSWRGLLSSRRLGAGLASVFASPPDGLLSHEPIRFGRMHFGMRQYWRDMDSLERFTRSEPHAEWWRNLKRYADGAGFWHETYHARGGFEAMYLGLPEPVGMQRFAPAQQPVGAYETARARVEAVRTSSMREN